MSEWNPQPIQKNASFVSNLIHGLKEGYGIWFSYDKITGHQGAHDWIAKMVEGNEYVYKCEGDHCDESYLEEDGDIERLAQEIIADGSINYYNISNIQGYVKSQPDPEEDDQDVGEYERNGPDPIEPQYESKNPMIKKNFLECLIRECAKEVLTQIKENRISDPSKEEMFNYLKSIYGKEEGFDDNAEVAMYWFSNFYHGGQTSNLYSMLSTSRFRPGPISKGPEKDSMEEDLYKDLVIHFAPGSEECIEFQKKHNALNEDETEGAPAPPADGQGTGDEPAIPKDKDPRPELPSKKETPPASLNLKGIIFINPNDKSTLQKVNTTMTDDASLERSLNSLAYKKTGSNKVKVSLSAIRMIKDAVRNPASATFLYIGKQDPTSEELFLLADKSLQIAKDSSCSPEELVDTSVSEPRSNFDPASASDTDYAHHLASKGQTDVNPIDEKVKNSIKELVNKILDGSSKKVNEFSIVSNGDREAMNNANFDTTTPPQNNMSSAEKSRQDRDAEHMRQQNLKGKELQLKTAKAEIGFQRQKMDQQKRFEIPSITKDIQRLKGAKI